MVNRKKIYQVLRKKLQILVGRKNALHTTTVLHACCIFGAIFKTIPTIPAQHSNEWKMQQKCTAFTFFILFFSQVQATRKRTENASTAQQKRIFTMLLLQSSVKVG